MGTVHYIDHYRPDPAALEAAMSRHPSARRTVTLTPKGERWLRNAYTIAVMVVVLAATILVMGLVGAIETAGL